jgi:hypothetical protein
MQDPHTTLPSFNKEISLVLMDLVCPSSAAKFVVRKNGKDGPKTMLTGKINKWRLLTLDHLTTPPFSKLKEQNLLLPLEVQVVLILLDQMALVCQIFQVLFKVRKNGKDGLKTTLTGLTNKQILLQLDFLMPQLLFNLATREK